MIPESQLEEGERLLFHGRARTARHVEPFEAAVSDRAVYVVAKESFAVRNPFVMMRIPTSQIESVDCRRVPSLGAWCLAAVLVVVGGWTTWTMFADVLKGRPGTRSGIPVGVLVVGVVIPFVAHGRWRLVITYGGRVFSWKPPLSVDPTFRRATRELIGGFVDACRGAGIHVIDEAAQRRDAPDETRGGW